MFNMLEIIKNKGIKKTTALLPLDIAIIKTPKIRSKYLYFFVIKKYDITPEKNINRN